MDVQVTKKEKSTVEIALTLPADVFAGFEQKALESLRDNVKMDGFREGKAPLDAVKKHVGSAALLDEMAHLAVIDSYPKIIEQEKIDAIGRPSIVIKKLAFGNPFECTIVTAVLPDINVGDYKKAAKKVMGEKMDTEVPQSEIDSALKELLRFRAHHEKVATNPEVKMADIKDDELPELTDEMVKSFGGFESKAQFIEKLTENMAAEKIDRARDKRRADLLEAIVADTKGEVPEMLVDYELSKMLAQLEQDLSRGGITLDGYLKQSNKTRNDIKTEWYAEAEKRAKMQLVLNHIATAEKIAPTDEEVSHEVAHIKEHYGDKQLDEANVRAYVVSSITNKKVIEFLESQK